MSVCGVLVSLYHVEESDFNYKNCCMLRCVDKYLWCVLVYVYTVCWCVWLVFVVLCIFCCEYYCTISPKIAKHDCVCILLTRAM